MFKVPWMHPGGDDPADSNVDVLPWAPEWSWRPGYKVGPLDMDSWAAILARCDEAEAAHARAMKRTQGYRRVLARKGIFI